MRIGANDHRPGIAARIIGAGLLALLAACQTLPDSAPFLDSTVALRSALSASGSAVDGELRATEALSDSADALKKEWDQRIRAADAMVAYAEQIAAITDAGNSGAASARGVADAVTGLAGAVGIAVPGGAALGTVIDVAAFVYQQIAIVRAAGSLKDALDATQPAVDRIAGKLAEDMAAMSGILVDAAATADTTLRLKNNIQTGYLRTLTEEQAAIYRSNRTDAAAVARLQELDKAIAAMRDWREPYEAARKAIADRRAAGLKLIAAGRQGIADWAVANRQLAVALKEGRRIDPKALAETIVEIRELVRKVRAL